MTNFTATEQTSLTNLSQYNANRYDQTGNPYGFAGVGYQTLFPQSLFDTATIASAVDRLATQVNIQTTANAAIVASRPKATSSTSNTIVASGNVTFTTNENLLTAQPFFVGDFVKVFNNAAPADYVWGTVTAVSANSITIAISTHGGSGTFTTWTIIATGDQGPATGIASVSADTSPALGGNMTTGGYTITFNAAGSKLTFNSTSSGIEMNGTPIKDAVMLNYFEVRQTNAAAINNVTLDPTVGTHAHELMTGNLNLLPPTLAVPAGEVCTMIVEVTAPSGSAYTLSFDPGFNTNGAVGGTVAAGTTNTYRITSDVKKSDGVTIYWKLYQVEVGRVLS